MKNTSDYSVTSKLNQNTPKKAVNIDVPKQPRREKRQGKKESYSLSESELDEVQRLLNLGVDHSVHLNMLIEIVWI